jgi:hypothetical protein
MADIDEIRFRMTLEGKMTTIESLLDKILKELEKINETSKS